MHAYSYSTEQSRFSKSMSITLCDMIPPTLSDQPMLNQAPTLACCCVILSPTWNSCRCLLVCVTSASVSLLTHWLCSSNTLSLVATPSAMPLACTHMHACCNVHVSNFVLVAPSLVATTLWPVALGALLSQILIIRPPPPPPPFLKKIIHLRIP